MTERPGGFPYPPTILLEVYVEALTGSISYTIMMVSTTPSSRLYSRVASSLRKASRIYISRIVGRDGGMVRSLQLTKSTSVYIPQQYDFTSIYYIETNNGKAIYFFGGICLHG